MKDSLAKIIQEIPTGLKPSLSPEGIPLWIDGRNVIFQEKCVQPIPGQYALFTKPEQAPVRGCLEFRPASADVKWIVWGTAKHLYTWNTGTGLVVDRTRASGDYSGDDETLWSFMSFGNEIIACNGQHDLVQYWNPTMADFDDLADVSAYFWNDAKAEVTRKLGPFCHIFGMDDNNGGSQAGHWSDEDSTSIWFPSTVTKAGDLAYRELESPIWAVEPIAGGLGVYGLDRLIMTEYVGFPLWFGQGRQVTGVGAISKNSIIPVGRLNYGMGPRGFFRTDGFEVEYIDQPDIHDWVYDNLNRDKGHLVCGWPDVSENSVFWSIPLGVDATDNNITVSFNFRVGVWTICSFARTAATSASILPYPITFDKYGNAYAHGVGSMVPSGEQKPMLLEATAHLQLGWGHGGWGQGGWGGQWDVDG